MATALPSVLPLPGAGGDLFDQIAQNRAVKPWPQLQIKPGGIKRRAEFRGRAVGQDRQRFRIVACLGEDAGDRSAFEKLSQP